MKMEKAVVVLAPPLASGVDTVGEISADVLIVPHTPIEYPHKDQARDGQQDGQQ